MSAPCILMFVGGAARKSLSRSGCSGVRRPHIQEEFARRQRERESAIGRWARDFYAWGKRVVGRWMGIGLRRERGGAFALERGDGEVTRWCEWYPARVGGCRQSGLEKLESAVWRSAAVFRKHSSVSFAFNMSLDCFHPNLELHARRELRIQPRGGVRRIGSGAPCVASRTCVTGDVAVNVPQPRGARPYVGEERAAEVRGSAAVDEAECRRGYDRVEEGALFSGSSQRCSGKWGARAHEVGGRPARSRGDPRTASSARRGASGQGARMSERSSGDASGSTRSSSRQGACARQRARRPRRPARRSRTYAEAQAWYVLKWRRTRVGWRARKSDGERPRSEAVSTKEVRFGKVEASDALGTAVLQQVEREVRERGMPTFMVLGIQRTKSIRDRHAFVRGGNLTEEFGELDWIHVGNYRQSAPMSTKVEVQKSVFPNVERNTSIVCEIEAMSTALIHVPPTTPAPPLAVTGFASLEPPRLRLCAGNSLYQVLDNDYLGNHISLFSLKKISGLILTWLIRDISNHRKMTSVSFKLGSHPACLPKVNCR
ncbi:hypothetical protein FB451DRAFT_1194179 [Mycena latifolia]|nr:hypothetical protein FB451DRAFT_1194179 [Mycena latifolia]